MIKDLAISQVCNATKEKTIKVSIKTDRGTFFACSPFGKSAGKYEARKLGLKAIYRDFPRTKKRFIGHDESETDQIIGSLGINKLGANFSIALSIACVRSMTGNDAYKFFGKKYSFPFPLGNVVGGGAHKGFTSEQEFLLLPLKAKNIVEAAEFNHAVWKQVGGIIKKKGIFQGSNYEGAWKCRLSDIGTLDMISDLAEDYGTRIGIDFASSEFYKNGFYHYNNPDRKLSPERQLDFVLDLIKTYKLAYVEDPFNENDFDSFAKLTRKARCLVTGDDLFVTNAKRLMMGIKKKAGNAIIIKPDQIGTVSKTLDTMRMAKKYGYTAVVSHRSGDTIDSFIADLAVGTSSPVLKCGIYGKERLAKLERLAQIWKKIDRPVMAKILI